MASKNKKQKSSFLGVLAFIAVLGGGVLLYSVFSQKEPETTLGVNTTGNGAPSGKHYQFNMIGVKNPKITTMSNDGRRMFVPLFGKCSIALSQGTFGITDYNCTDSKAGFRLPSPDPDADGITDYSVWIRTAGKPGGSAVTTPCVTDVVTDPNNPVTYCSTQSVVSVRSTGSSKFTDVSRQLLYVYVDIDGTGIKRYPLFSTALDGWAWTWEDVNNGLKHRQLRFYPISSNVN